MEIKLLRHCKTEHFQISQRPTCEPHAATVRPWHHTATTLSHNHVVTQPRCHTANTLSHNHTVLQQPHYHTITLSHNHTVTRPRCHTATTLSHNHVVTQPHCHIHYHVVTQPHCHITTLSHDHTVTQQPRFHMTTLSHNSTHIYFGALLALVAHPSFLTGSTQWGFSGPDGVMALAAHGKLYWVLHCFDWKLEKWTQTINNLAFLLLSYWGCGWGGREHSGVKFSVL